MNFEGLYEKYQRGTASEEERRQMEEELAKFRLLADCVAGQDELDLPEPQSEAAGEYRRVKRRLRRRTAGIVLAAAALSCAAVLGGGFLWREAVAPFLNEHVYYNPLEEKTSNYAEEVSVELRVFTSLHFPHVSSYLVTGENTGLGSYDLTIQERDWRTGEQTYSYGTVDKGAFQLEGDFWKRWPVMSSFTRGTRPFEEPDPERAPEAVAEKLGELPGYLALSMAVSFRRDLSMGELAALMEGHPELDFYWVGVRNSPEERQYLPLLGFEPREMILWDNETLLEDYPYLMHYRHEDDPDRGRVYEEHVKDLLRYQLDHGGLVEAVCSEGAPRTGYYQEVLDYVEGQGVNTYGVCVSGRAGDLAGLCGEETVEQVSLEAVRLSPDLG